MKCSDFSEMVKRVEQSNCSLLTLSRAERSAFMNHHRDCVPCASDLLDSPIFDREVPYSEWVQLVADQNDPEFQSKMFRPLVVLIAE